MPYLNDLCLAQLGDSRTRGVCFDACLEGTGGRMFWPPGSFTRVGILTRFQYAKTRLEHHPGLVKEPILP